MTGRALLFTVALTAAMAPAPVWRSATPGRVLMLPADHASHPDYRIEWWYYTGNLDTADGRRLGYQLTFFRVGVDPSPVNPSRWAVRDLYMAHAAVTDVDGRSYRFDERMNRAAPGWAGASTETYRVWNEDWHALLGADGRHLLRAATERFTLDLRLEEGRRPVFHGDRGFSQKGAAQGNASHYYSLTRMPTRGTVTLEGRQIEVAGYSWMDHEFGTSFLEPSQRGWDWFSVQLDDGRDLMIFQMRRLDGSIDPRSSGTLVEPDGSYTVIPFDSGFSLEPSATWTSPASGAVYPLRWRIRIPAHDLDLSVSAAVAQQELHTERSSGISYWEGAVDISGGVRGRAVRGRGYLEMTGYAGPAMGSILK